MIKKLFFAGTLMLTASLHIFGQTVQQSESWLWKNEIFKDYNPNDEIVERRTIDTKHFRTGKKEVVAFVAAGPINYFEKNRWNTIYHTILPSSNGFQNVTNAFKSYYPATSKGALRTRLKSGDELTEMQQMQMYFTDASGNKISEQPIADRKGKADFNELTYSQAYGNHIDLRLTQLTTKRKLDYIIKNKNAFSDVSSSAQKIVFEEVVKLPAGWSAELTDNLIYLKNASGTIQAIYEKPVIRETVLHDHKEGENHSHHDHETTGSYELTTIENNQIRIKTIVSLNWLMDSERAFPIIIDPTINCIPDNANQWTGHLALSGTSLTDYGTNTIGYRTNEEMRVGRVEQGSDIYFMNSWAKFNLTSIPDYVSVCSARLNYTVYGTYSGGNGCGSNVRIHHMANDPSTATNAVLQPDLKDGDIYLTRDFGGATNGPNGNKTTDYFSYMNHFQSALVPNWIALGMEYYLSGVHSTCHLFIYGYSNTNKPYLIIDYTDVSSATNVGYTAPTNGTLPPNPTCTDWSNTWCAGSGTFSQTDNLVQGVNYSVENLGTANCGTAMTTAYMQAWAPGGSNCGYTPLGTVSTNAFSFNGTVNGSYYFNVSTGLCGSPNTCGEFNGHDFTGQSALLRYRQNTTVTNTTSTASLCFGQTRNLTATLGGPHDNPSIQWNITSGASLGTISGNTFTAGTTTGQVTVEAVVGFCRESITFNIVEGAIINNTDFALCSGETTNIQIDSSPPLTSYSWTQTSSNATGASNGSGTSIAHTLSTAASGSGSVVYTIEAVSSGCTSIKAITVTVNEELTPSFNTVNPICAGEVLSPLSATSINGVSGTWSPALDNMQTTTYTFTPSAGQCATTNTLSITVNPQQTPLFDQVNPFCEGSTVSPLPTTSSNGVTGSWLPAIDNTQTTTYTFTPDAAQCANPASMTIVMATELTPAFTAVAPICAGATLAPLPATSNNNITGTWSPALNNTATTTYTFTPDAGQCGLSTTLTITVNQLPNVQAPADYSICSGLSTSLSGSGAQGYSWDNSIANGVSFNPTQTTTYTVTGTDVNGCMNTDNVTITVHPYPAVDAGPDQTICLHGWVILTGSGDGTLNWNNGVQDGIPVSPGTTQTYTLTATSAENCVSTDQVTVTVNIPASINAGPDQTVCFGTPVTLSGSGGISYQWSNNVINNQPFQPAVGTITYNVTGTGANGCTNGDLVVVTVVPAAEAAFEVDQSEGQPALTVSFTNTSTGANSYFWNFGNGSTSTAPSPTHTYTEVGSYEVTLMASNGICSDIAKITITVLPFLKPEITVPNVFTPNGDQANELWWIDVKMGKSIEVMIFNRWGNLMHTMTTFEDRWDGRSNGNEVADGVYFYKYHIEGINGDVLDGHGHLTLER